MSGMSDMASMSTMSMAGMGSMSSPTASAMASMAGMDHSGMDHSGTGMSHMAGMHMYFTTQFKDYPVLFSSLSASNKAQAFGIFVLLFAVAFFTRSLEFLRNYLEARVWRNPAYEAPCKPGAALSAPAAKSCCADDVASSTNEKFSDNAVDREQTNPPAELPLATRMFRDTIRLFLCVVPDILSYALMLAAMTYTLTYFFAIAVGSGVGRFAFERLSDRYRVSPGYFSSHC